MDDLEGGGVEPLVLREVPGESGGDRDVDVGEPGDRPVGRRERPSVAERVEPVLRRDGQGDAC